MNPDSRTHIRGLLRTWDRGVITDRELTLRLLQALTEETAEELSSALSSEVFALLLRDVQRAPSTEDGWDSYRIITAGAIAVGSPTGPLEKPWLTETVPYRRGVELFRATHECFPAGHPIVSIEPNWLTAEVIALASMIRTETALDRFPILADALQDAGCNSEAVLNHCRANCIHIRGCWILGLIADASTRNDCP